MNPVKFNNISHFYGKRKVLSGITFEAEENKITVILGKSGSGKSTMLQMINGLIIPSEGEVYVFGNKIDYNDIYALRHKIGYSVQGTGLFPHMSVYENIALPATITGMDKEAVKPRIEELMETVNLSPDFINKYPYQLSGGEQQRVGICRAMVLNPPIFLLDEAFGALDPFTRSEIHKEVLNLQKHEPRTIIMVTHDLHEAERLADKIMVIDNGIIQQYGTKDEIANNPSNETVKNFFKTQY